ncbi:MAG: DUF433 domain-containing protein [Gemmatimonadota bacterium]|nr:DUF433 domain-containing protein [Gemmatimonadota bacterium]
MQTNPELLSQDPEILGGTTVFSGTRVPVQNLIDYLASGQTLDEFLEDFPSVSREQAMSVLRLAQEALVAGASPPACGCII